MNMGSSITIFEFTESNPKTFAQKLYELKCGEEFCPDSNSTYIRVPGGWIYANMAGTIFIPWNNEYQSVNEDITIPEYNKEK